MNKISFQRRRKSAVSEIVATILMIVVVIALSAVVFAYATNGLSGFSSGFTNLLSNSGDALSEKIVIEQATFNTTSYGGTPYGAILYIRNVGTNIAYISAVYVENLTSSTPVVSLQLSPSLSVNQGAFQKLAVRFTPDVGNTYAFTVATSRGNTVVVDAKA